MLAITAGEADVSEEHVVRRHRWHSASVGIPKVTVLAALAGTNRRASQCQVYAGI